MFDGSLNVRRDVPLMSLFVDEVLSLLASSASLEEFGAVIALRAVAWKAGAPLPDKPARLAGICKVSQRYWKETLRPAIVEVIAVRDGYLRDDEMERQHAAAAARVEAARLKGRLGGLATAAARTQRVQKTYGLRKPNPLENNNPVSSWAGSKYTHKKEVEAKPLLPPSDSESVPAARAREATRTAPVEPDIVFFDGSPPPKPWVPPTPEERAKVLAMFAKARAEMAAQAPPPPPFPTEETPEEIAEFERRKAQLIAELLAFDDCHGSA
jgi:uncharacterized protein YdaU (DUF1376 family)